MNARDMQAMARIWSQEPDIALFDVAPPGRFAGWPEIARSFNQFFERVENVKMVATNVRVSAGADLAYATYDWALAGTLAGAPIDDQGQATAVYRREKDGWRLVHAHYSATVLPPATASKPATKQGG